VVRFGLLAFPTSPLPGGIANSPRLHSSSGLRPLIRPTPEIFQAKLDFFDQVLGFMGEDSSFGDPLETRDHNTVLEFDRLISPEERPKEKHRTASTRPRAARPIRGRNAIKQTRLACRRPKSKLSPQVHPHHPDPPGHGNSERATPPETHDSARLLWEFAGARPVLGEQLMRGAGEGDRGQSPPSRKYIPDRHRRPGKCSVALGRYSSNAPHGAALDKWPFRRERYPGSQDSTSMISSDPANGTEGRGS